MTNDWHAAEAMFLALCATYLLHSTLWLSTAWIVTATVGRSSWSLQERLWRWAVVLPVLTTAGQCLLPIPAATSAWTWTLITEASPTPTAPATSKIGRFPDRREIPAATGQWSDADFDLIEAEPADTTLSSSGLPISLPATKPAKASVGATTSRAGKIAGTLSTRQKPTPPEIAPTRVPASTSGWGWKRISIAIVGAWMVIGLVRVLLCGFLAWRQVRRLRLITGGTALSVLEDLQQRYDIRRRVCLVAAECGTEPAVFGLRQWTIVLPSDLIMSAGKNDQKTERLRALLSHELAHLARGDVGWLWVGRLFVNVLGWQPLNSLAFGQWRAASEHLCDDWAVDRGVKAVTLAHCLTEVAERRLSSQAPVAGLTLGGRPRLLTSRIRRLTELRDVDRWQSRTRRHALSAVLVFAASGLVWTGPQFVGAAPAAPKQSALPRPLRTPEAVEDEPALAFPIDNTPPAELVTDDEIAAALTELRSDLTYAIELFNKSNTDPETAALVRSIEQRVNSLESAVKTSPTAH